MVSMTRRRVLGAAVMSAALAATVPARAQAFPAKPVRIVLPFSAGSGPDTVIRHVGEKLSRGWNQPVTIDNRPGANGWLAAGEVKRANPDGYNLLLTDVATIALQPHLYRQMPFDPVADFVPVAPLYSTNFFVVVGADSPYKSVAELLAAAKSNPDKITYGSWGIGSVAHIGAARVQSSAGVQMRHIPFKEIPQLYGAVATGEVDWAFGTAATVGGLYRAKRVRLLAYAGPQRLAAFADVPTIAESTGLGAFELRSWVALFAPRGTPNAVVDRIHGDVAVAMNESDLRERLAAVGFDVWSASPNDIARTAATDSARFAETVKAARITLD